MQLFIPVIPVVAPHNKRGKAKLLYFLFKICKNFVTKEFCNRYLKTVAKLFEGWYRDTPVSAADDIV